MRIGTVRAEEAKVFDSEEGTHRLHEPDGSVGERRVEVFFHDGGHMVEPAEGDDMPLDDWRDPEKPGWYAREIDDRSEPCGEMTGPHASSWQALEEIDFHAPDPDAPETDPEDTAAFTAPGL